MAGWWVGESADDHSAVASGDLHGSVCFGVLSDRDRESAGGRKCNGGGVVQPRTDGNIASDARGRVQIWELECALVPSARIEWTSNCSSRLSADGDSNICAEYRGRAGELCINPSCFQRGSFNVSGHQRVWPDNGDVRRQGIFVDAGDCKRSCGKSCRDSRCTARGQFSESRNRSQRLRPGCGEYESIEHRRSNRTGISLVTYISKREHRINSGDSVSAVFFDAIHKWRWANGVVEYTVVAGCGEWQYGNNREFRTDLRRLEYVWAGSHGEQRIPATGYSIYPIDAEWFDRYVHHDPRTVKSSRTFSGCTE